MTYCVEQDIKLYSLILMQAKYGNKAKKLYYAFKDLEKSIS